jgi:hypothetical protein
MADPTLDVGEQAKIGLSALDRAGLVQRPEGRPGMRRPWHPSQGGAPWDREGTEDVVDCDCPACQRAARR